MNRVARVRVCGAEFPISNFDCSEMIFRVSDFWFRIAAGPEAVRWVTMGYEKFSWFDSWREISAIYFRDFCMTIFVDLTVIFCTQCVHIHVYDYFVRRVIERFIFLRGYNFLRIPLNKIRHLFREYNADAIAKLRRYTYSYEITSLAHTCYKFSDRHVL